MKKTLLITAACLTTIISQAATFTVQNTNDSGLGSLRAEIGNAVDGDTIRFNPSIISGGSATITLASEIAFSNAITIIGLLNSTDTLFISGNNNSRVFGITSTVNKVTLDSLILINGNGVGAYASGIGGAVFIQTRDTLFISNSIIRNNTASRGGGIASHSHSGPVTYVTVTNSTISGNSAINNGGGLYAGAGAYSDITVTNSTISENTANANGGGIYSNAGSPGAASYTSTVTITNSTISGNSADNGGGVYSTANSLSSTNTSTVTVTNSTFSGNTATTAGAGIRNSSNSTPVTIVSSIFDGSSIDNNGANSITSNGYNIFTDAPTGTVATDNINITPATINLGALANNGGTTPTMLPGGGSVAINMGAPTDMSAAQNHTVSEGRRDVGAAETVCVTTAGVLNETVCIGDSITVNGTIYNAANLIGTEVFTNVGSDNCDSTVTVNLTILPELTGIHNETVCFGGNIVVNGNTYDANTLTGTEVFIGAGPNNNCDSTVAVTLIIENAIDITTTTTDLTIESNQTGATYRWLDCNNGNAVIAGATNANYTATANGDYAIEITVGNCIDTTACVNISTVSIENQTSNINLSIHPNPATNKLTIENVDFKINTISILNITGAIVRIISGNTKIIDVSNLTKGIYFLQIRTDNDLINKKFIKG
jgi:hypothetical protein